jgi:hypothetical protein
MLDLGRWLERMLSGSWAVAFRKAAALRPGLVIDSRTVSPKTERPYLWPARRASALFMAHALQLQARGDDAAALDHLTVVLSLSRLLRHNTPLDELLVARAMEAIALDGLQRWLENLGPRKDLLRRALDELRRHEERTPSLSGNVKAESYVSRNDLEFLFRHERRLPTQLLALASQAPWERARLGRVHDASVARELRLVNRPYWEGSDIAWGKTPWGRVRSRALDSLTVTFFSANPWSSVMPRCRVRAVRLQVALAAYQAKERKPAARLDDLVPRYLKTIPVDPFSGRPFGYRVSAGEKIEVAQWQPEGEPRFLTVSAGQGVLWSTGADRSDDGGRKQGLDLDGSAPSSREPGLDLIFLVPQWPKR